MRMHEPFVLGAVTGAAVAWLWRRPIDDAFRERTRELGTKAADRAQAVEETIRPA
jgi:hypothetical protein